MLDIQELIPRFRKKFMSWPIKAGTWGTQLWYDGKSDIAYRTEHHALTLPRLRDHFSGVVKKTSFGKESTSIGIRGEFTFSRVKWFCADLDNDPAVEACRERLLPVYEKYGIDYIWEYGGYNREKAHLWFFCNTSNVLLRKFVEALFAEAEIDFHGMNIEMFPTHKPNFLLRVPGGVHLRSGQIMPLEYRGKLYGTPSNIIKAILKCKRVPETLMAEVVGAGMENNTEADPSGVLSNDSEIDGGGKKRRKEFIFQRRRLPHDYTDAPDIFSRLTSECQALHKLVEMADDGYLEERGGTIHNAGLYLMSVFDADRRRLERQKDYEAAEIVKDYAELWLEDHRVRDWESHKWMYEANQDAAYYVPKCEVWQRDLNLCKGCPFAGRTGFKNPIQLYYGSPLKKEIVSDVETATGPEIKADVNTKAQKLIWDAYRKEKKLNLVIASKQDTFKSTSVSENAVKFARAGCKVLIAVPRGDLGIEQLLRIRSLGGDAFFVGSHKTLFEHFIPRTHNVFQCPNADPIQAATELGISRRSIVYDYCNGCQYRKECPYPRQYQNVQDTPKKIVIIQHAHFSSGPALRMILKKRFDILFVDETFIDNIYKYARLKKVEWFMLSYLAKSFDWAKTLCGWVQGKPPGKELEVPIQALRRLRTLYEKKRIPWQLKFLIDSFNAGKLYYKSIGIFRFHPLPKINIRVLTDATAPMEYIKTVLNVSRIKIIGSDKILDASLYNPENKFIKVIDGSTSKTALSDTERYAKILKFIGYKARTEYQDLTILVTVYKSDIEKVRQFFDEYYPNEAPRITVAGMAVGVNSWQDINVQFQLCGVHLNTRQMRIIQWKMRNIANFWRVQEGKKEIVNPFPFGIKDDTQSNDPPIWVPVQVKLATEEGAKLVKFPQLMVAKPRAHDEQQAHFLSLGKTQQGRRIRLKKAKKDRKGNISEEEMRKTVRHYWNWSGRYEPGTLYQEVYLEDECFAQAGLNND